MCFELLGQLTKVCTVLLDVARKGCDIHGRSPLLITYLRYFKLAFKGRTPPEALSVESKIKFVGFRRKSEDERIGSPESEKIFNLIGARTISLQPLEDQEKNGGSRKGSLPLDALASTNNKVCLFGDRQLPDAARGDRGTVDPKQRSGTRERLPALVVLLRTYRSFFPPRRILQIKSMAEFLSMTGRLYVSRRARFSGKFIRAFEALSAATLQEVRSVCNSSPRRF